METKLRRRVNLKRITLPDRTTFYARYERVSRANLTANVTTKRTRAIGPRQQGAGLLSSAFSLGSRLFKPSYIEKGSDIGPRVVNFALGKKTIEERIKQTPAIYNAGVKVIKQNKIKKVLESDLANYAVKKYRDNSLTDKMSEGISNFQIESTIKNLNDEDIMKNFTGVFPANRMNKFINFKVMISEKSGKYPFFIANTDSLDKNGAHWWSIQDIEPKTDLF